MTHDDPNENLLARKPPVATWAEPARGTVVNDETRLYIDWGADGWGWGTLNFWREGDTLVCDNECMSRRFCKTVLEKLVAEIGREPALLRLHGSIDALLAAAMPKNPAPDWPSWPWWYCPGCGLEMQCPVDRMNDGKCADCNEPFLPGRLPEAQRAELLRLAEETFADPFLIQAVDELAAEKRAEFFRLAAEAGDPSLVDPSHPAVTRKP